MVKERDIELSGFTGSLMGAAIGDSLGAPYAVALALKIRPSNLNRHEFLADLKRFVRVRAYQEKLDILEGLMDQDGNREEIVRRLGNGIEAINSVPTAIYSVLSHYLHETSRNYQNSDALKSRN